MAQIHLRKPARKNEAEKSERESENCIDVSFLNYHNRQFNSSQNDKFHQFTFFALQIVIFIYVLVVYWEKLPATLGFRYPLQLRKRLRAIGSRKMFAPEGDASEHNLCAEHNIVERGVFCGVVADPLVGVVNEIGSG